MQKCFWDLFRVFFMYWWRVFVVDSYSAAQPTRTLKTVGGCCLLNSQLAVTLRFLQLTLRFVGGGTASKKTGKTHKYTKTTAQLLITQRSRQPVQSPAHQWTSGLTVALQYRFQRLMTTSDETHAPREVLNYPHWYLQGGQNNRYIRQPQKDHYTESTRLKTL